MSAAEEHLRLRKHLRGEQHSPVWPAAISPMPLTAIDAQAAHAVLEAAFPGQVAAFADWHGNLLSDAEYDPNLAIAAVTETGEVVGFVQCWTSNFIKDLAVAPAWRRQGVGAALMLHAFALFAASGATSVDLKVLREETTPRRLYARLGMVEVP